MSTEGIFTISLWATKMPWPLSFAEHLWFVVTAGSVTTRVEVWAPLFVVGKTTVIHNALPPTVGFRTSFFDSIEHPKRRGSVRQLLLLTGDSDSTAAALASVILQAQSSYPYRQRYRLWPGPNSNTFVAWALAQVPEVQVTLPNTAYGKRYPLPK